MEKIINSLINNWTKGVDTYTHNGSTWLIFTDSKKWVIELTDSKTLWYNYNFFKQIFEFTSLDVVEHQSYITKWVEDNVINKELTYATLFRDARDRKQQFEDALENGVRRTDNWLGRDISIIEDTIQNGIKETRPEINITEGEVDDIIQDGVKHTARNNACADWEIEDTIQNGVKETIECDWSIPKYVIDEVVDEGVKETIFAFVGGSTLAEDVLQNGVKHTDIGWHQCNNVDDTIEKGVKETNHVDVMKFFDNKMEDTLQNGVKEIKADSSQNPMGNVDKVIENGVRDTQSNTYENESWIEGVIKNGVKETKQKKNAYLVLGTRGRELILESHLVIRDGVKETNYDTDNYTDDVKEVIREGVKETSHRQFLKTYDVKDTIQDGTEHDRWILDGCADPVDVVLDNGVKTSHPRQYVGYIDDIIKEGEKINGTYAGGQRQSEKCKSVVEYGKQI